VSSRSAQRWALTATLGLAAASWVVALRQMNGMDMGVRPGAAPAVVQHAHGSGGARAVSLFVGSYLAVWTLVGVAVYRLYRPHASSAAGAVAIAAGVYELTPLKRHFRPCCRESARSGFEFGLH
jgi:predicted metal-binding membrane protein